MDLPQPDGPGAQGTRAAHLEARHPPAPAPRGRSAGGRGGSRLRSRSASRRARRCDPASLAPWLVSYPGNGYHRAASTAAREMSQPQTSRAVATKSSSFRCCVESHAVVPDTETRNRTAGKVKPVELDDARRPRPMRALESFAVSSSVTLVLMRPRTAMASWGRKRSGRSRRCAGYRTQADSRRP